MVPHLLDFMRGFLREDKLAPHKVDDDPRWENDTILEPSDWQEKQNEFSPSSVDLPDGIKIAHRMGILQQEFPMLCRSGIIPADPLENIASFRNESRVDYIYPRIFPRSLDRAIGDWTKGRVSIAIIQEKD